MANVTISTISLSGEVVTQTLAVNEGTEATTSATETINGQTVVAKMTLTALVIDTIVGAAAEAIGKLIYTLPAGNILVRAMHMDIGLSNTDGNVDADTPDVGIGTVIGTGAVATLDGTSTFENLLTGQTFTNCTGTKTVKGVVNQTLFIEANEAHTIHLNVADTWAGAETTGLAATGTITLEYVVLS